MIGTTSGDRKADAKSGNINGISDSSAIVLAVVLSIFFLCISLYIGRQRILWFDEIITALISGQSWPGDVLQILKTGADQQPLPFYGLVKLSGRLLGLGAFSLRLPSALAMFASLLVVFDCTRRLTNGLYGLIAGVYIGIP